MKNICTIFLVTVSINFVYSAMFMDLQAFHPDHPDKCYDKKDDHLFSPGENYKPIGRCMTLDCLAPGKISGKSCGVAVMADCKSIGNDLTKPHPFCCERFLCKDKNGKEHIIAPSGFGPQTS